MKTLYTLLLSALVLASCSTEKADLIIHNAKIYTVNDAFDIKSAVAIKDGKFIAIGGEEILSKYNANDLLDLKGLAVYPGLIDAHCHFYQLGLAQEQVDLRGSKSVEEIIDRINAHLEENNDEVILGRGWDQNLWEEKVFPNKTALDQAFPGKLVILERVDGHAAYVNSEVLNRAKITAKTKLDGGEVILENGTLLVF